MAGPRQRPTKKKIILYKNEDSGSSVQIAGGVAKIRLTWVLVVIVLLLVLVVVAIVMSPSKEQGAIGTAARTTPVTGPTGTATTIPVGNMPPEVTSAVIVPDRPTADMALAVKYSTTQPEGDGLVMEFRWYADSALVQKGPHSSLETGPIRKGSTVYAEVVPADQYSTGRSFTTAPVVIANSPPSLSSVTLGPAAAYVGTVMTATPAGTDPDGDPISYTYQWRVNGNPVGAPGNESTFSTADLKKRDNISVLVTFTDGEAVGKPVASNTIMLQNQAPKILSSPPLEVTSGLYSYQVIAKDPDGDPLTYRLNRFPAGMSIDGTSGLVAWALPKGVLYKSRQEIAVAVTVSDGDGGSDSQEFTIVIFELMVP